MEKIKQAISKAKSNRVHTKSDVQLDTVKPSYNAQPKKSHVSDDDLENVNYSQTKVIKLNQFTLEKNRVVAFDKNNRLSAVFDLLRVEVLRKMEENNWRTLAVVSPTPESGKTFVSINLSMSIAHQLQKSVLLVDFDLRRPKIAKYLGLSVEKSLNDYLDGDASLSDVLINPGLPRMVILPTNKPVLKSSELLSTKRIEEFITEIRERYSSRIVVFDLPPILNVDDARVVLPQVDCVLLVVSNGLNNQTEIEDAMKLMPKDRFLGVVLNKSEDNIRSYYY